MPHAGYFFENFVNLFKIAGHHWTSAAQNIYFSFSYYDKRITKRIKNFSYFSVINPHTKIYLSNTILVLELNQYHIC